MPIHTLPAGTYWIGDPCYLVADEDWDELLRTTGFFGLPDHSSTNWDDGLFEYKGGTCFAWGTSYGDGLFSLLDDQRQEVAELGVDAGLLGILPDTGVVPTLMYKVTFDEDFEVWERNGLFYFGGYTVDTNIWSWVKGDDDE